MARNTCRCEIGRLFSKIGYFIGYYSGVPLKCMGNLIKTEFRCSNGGEMANG